MQGNDEEVPYRVEAPIFGPFTPLKEKEILKNLLSGIEPLKVNFKFIKAWVKLTEGGTVGILELLLLEGDQLLTSNPH
jgi:hypothetical protein